MEGNWKFKEYIASELQNSIFENEDVIIETLNTVKEFYETESLVLSCTNDRSGEDFKEWLSQISELHDLLLKLEFIYVYKLSEILERPAASDRSDKLLEFFLLYRRIEEILFLWWYESSEYWYDFFEYSYYYWRSMRLLQREGVDYAFDERFIEQLIFLTEILSKAFSDRINELQNRMMPPKGTLHFVTVRNTRKFHKKFPRLIKLYLDDKLYKKAFESRKISCYATIEFKGEKYITVNGIELDNPKEKILQKFTEVLASLGKTNVKIVGISNGVRYYLKDQQQYIEYEDFKQQKVDKKHNRMFTCCERKLFAKLREKDTFKTPSPKEKANLSTTMSPCAMCQREINVLNNKIKVSCLDTSTQNINISESDEIATGILKNKDRV